MEEQLRFSPGGRQGTVSDLREEMHCTEAGHNPGKRLVATQFIADLFIP